MRKLSKLLINIYNLVVYGLYDRDITLYDLYCYYYSVYYTNNDFNLANAMKQVIEINDRDKDAIVYAKGTIKTNNINYDIENLYELHKNKEFYKVDFSKIKVIKE